MKPLKVKDIVPLVATQLNMPSETVDAVTAFYWSEVRAALTNMKYVRVHLTNLGDFTIKHWLLDKYIKKYDNISQRLMSSETRQLMTSQVNEKLKLLKEMRDNHEAEMQRKDFIKQHKKLSNDPNQQFDTDMEEQGTDPGGSDQ